MLSLKHHVVRIVVQNEEDGLPQPWQLAVARVAAGQGGLSRLGEERLEPG